MARAVLVALPVHAGLGWPEDLHPVHPYIATAGLRVVGKHERGRYVAAGVKGPALERGEHLQGGNWLDDLLATTMGNVLGRDAAEVLQLEEEANFVAERARGRGVRQSADVIADVVQAFHAEREAHTR